jgi:hypothetical protein
MTKKRKYKTTQRIIWQYTCWLRKHIDQRKINISAKDKLASSVVNSEWSPLTTKSMYDESRMAGTVVSGGQPGQGRQCCRACQDIRPFLTKIPQAENKLRLKEKNIFQNSLIK